MSLIKFSRAIKEEKKRKKVYRCPDCPRKYNDANSLYQHVAEDHADNIPDGWSVKRYVFNRKYNKTTGKCVICGNPTEWNEDKVRYERFCSEDCKKEARERFRKNAKKKLGTDNPASDPEHQKKAIAGRRTSGMYKFSDGGEVGYSSSYEQDFLRFCDEEMGFTSLEVMQAEMTFKTVYMVDGKKYNAFHIPDFYIPMYNLIIQIKDGGDNPNMNSHVQSVGRARQRAADLAIIKDGHYNYIKIVNKVYDDFINMIQVLKDRDVENNTDQDPLIVIPE